MKMALQIRPEAHRDALSAYLYLARESPRVADRFVDALEAAYTRLLEFPGAGAPVVCESPRLAGLRKWSLPGFRSYLIFYRMMPAGIEVIRVLHSARDIDAILAEEAEVEEG